MSFSLTTLSHGKPKISLKKWHLLDGILNREHARSFFSQAQSNKIVLHGIVADFAICPSILTIPCSIIL